MIGMYLTLIGTLNNLQNVLSYQQKKCLVIKNGIEDIEPVITTYKRGGPIKIIHHCTPWRGLSVLLGAMQLIKNPLISLDVYSSCEVYGKDFAEVNDKHYQSLYNQAKQLSNVNYIGYKPNEYIKQNLKDYRLFVYPSIWEETSCISLLESMSAGLYCITTNFGAIYETAEFPMYFLNNLIVTFCSTFRVGFWFLIIIHCFL